MASKETDLFDRFPELIKANRGVFGEALTEFREEHAKGQPPQDNEPDRHYDRDGYCDNPARGY